MKSINFILEKLRFFLNKAVAIVDRNSWLKVSFQLIIVGSSITYLYTNIKIINLKEIQSNFNVGVLLWSVSGFTAAIFLGAFGWWIISKAFGFKIPILTSSLIHTKANLAKYLPGYGWQMIGKIYLSSKLGIPKNTVATAMFVEFSLIFIVGISIISWIIPSQTIAFMGLQIPQMIYLPLLRSVSIALLILFPFVVKWVIKKAGYPGDIRLGFLYLATTVIMIGWLVNAYSFWLLILAFDPISMQSFGLSTFILIASFLLGFLIFIVPGSIGVRESIMAFLMASLLPGPSGVVIAIIQRAALIVSDIVGYLILQLIPMIFRIGITPVQNNPNG